MKTSNRSEKLDFRVGNVIGNRIEGNDLATHRSVGKIIIGRWEPNTFGNVHTDSFGCQEGGTHRSERNTRFGLRLREDKEGELEMKMLMSDIQRRVPDDVVLEHGLEEVRVILFEEYDKYKSVRKSQQVKK